MITILSRCKRIFTCTIFPFLEIFRPDNAVCLAPVTFVLLRSFAVAPVIVSLKPYP